MSNQLTLRHASRYAFYKKQTFFQKLLCKLFGVIVLYEKGYDDGWGDAVMVNNNINKEEL